MDLFDIAAKISLNTSDYERNLSDAESKGSGFADKLKKGLGTAAKVGGAAIAAIGAGSVALGAKFVDGMRDVATYGDEVDKMSQKLGLSKTAYQEWDYVLGQAGVEITNMSTGLKTLTNKLDEAKNGSKDAQSMFEKIGLSLEDLQGMSREDAFAEVISGFQGMADSTERAALANDLFGRSGQELTPLFNSSIEQTNELRQAAHDLGFVLSDEAVGASADFNDALDTLTRTVSGIKNQFIQNFLPAATKVMDGLTAIFGGNSSSGVGMIKEGIQKIVDSLSSKIPEFLNIGLGIIDALLTSITENLPTLIEKGADLLLNGIIPGIIEQLPMLVETAFSIIGQLATSIGQALPELIPAAISMVLQLIDALLSPDGIDLLIDGAIGLIMGLADGLISATPLLIEKAPEIVIKFVEAIIRNAPKLWSAAVELIKKLVDGLRSAFNQLLIAGKELIEWIGNGIESLWPKVKAWGAEIIDKIWNGLKSGITNAYTWGKDMIDNFGKGITAKAQALLDKVKGIASKIKSYIGFSEPEDGPLSDFHTYAPDMMELFMKGIEDNKRRLERTVSDAFDFGGIISAGSGFENNSVIRPAVAGAVGGFNGQVNLYIDGDKLVGTTSQKMDRDLGNMQKLKARWEGEN